MKPFIPLTARQVEIMRYISEGEDDARIALLINIRVQSVKNQVSNIQRRLGVSSRTSIAVYALTGWLPPDAETRRRSDSNQKEDIDFTLDQLGGFDDGY
jgi:DNA-binding CsgD family transcriptional regulator